MKKLTRHLAIFLALALLSGNLCMLPITAAETGDSSSPYDDFLLTDFDGGGILNTDGIVFDNAGGQTAAISPQGGTLVLNGPVGWGHLDVKDGGTIPDGYESLVVRVKFSGTNTNNFYIKLGDKGGALSALAGLAPAESPGAFKEYIIPMSAFDEGAEFVDLEHWNPGTVTVDSLWLRPVMPLYNPGDIAIINGMIDSTSLTWSKAPEDGSSVPASWGWGVGWNSDSRNKRVKSISFCDTHLGGSIDLSGLEALEYLDFTDEYLTALNISNCPSLKTVSIPYNYIRELDLSGKPNLTSLSCPWNYLTELDVVLVPSLTSLNCEYNSLTELDIAGSPMLTSLNCNHNNLTELDISNNPALVYLECSANKLAEMNVIEHTELEYLGCHGNQLSELDVTNCTKLKKLSCGANKIPQLDVSNCTRLNQLSCSGNLLTELSVVNSPDMEYLWCNDNRLTELIIGNTPKMMFFECYNNKLTELDVSNCGVRWLHCEDNQLTELDVTKNVSLERLYCQNNQLTKLDVTKNKYLQWLYCDNNRLTELDLSGSVSLQYLYCTYNELTYLDIRKTKMFPPSQRYIDCRFNYFKSRSDVPGIETFTTNAYNYFEPQHVALVWNGSGDAVASFEMYNPQNRQLNSLTLNGAEVDSSNYTVADQTDKIITLKESYLKTLPNGTHLFKADIAYVGLLYIKLMVDNEDVQEPIYNPGDVAVINRLIDENGLIALEKAPADGSGVPSAWGDYIIWSGDRENKRIIKIILGHTVNQNFTLSGDIYLTGLDALENLTLQGFYNSQVSQRITSLNVSGCPALKRLSCRMNWLTELDVSNNPALEYLDCSSNFFDSQDDIIGIENIETVIFDPQNEIVDVLWDGSGNLVVDIDKGLMYRAFAVFNNKKIDQGNYTFTGNWDDQKFTDITIKELYLQSLGNGSHMIFLPTFSSGSDYGYIAIRVNKTTPTPQTVIMRIDNLYASVNGKKVRVNDAQELAPIFNETGRTMVPFRFIATCFGAEVDWDEGLGSVIIDHQGKHIQLPIGLPYAIVDGVQTPINAPAEIMTFDRTFVPFRAVAELLGGVNVEYDFDTMSIIASEGEIDVAGCVEEYDSLISG